MAGCSGRASAPGERLRERSQQLPDDGGGDRNNGGGDRDDAGGNRDDGGGHHDDAGG